MKKVILLLFLSFCAMDLGAQEFFDDTETSNELAREAEITSLRTERPGSWGTRPRGGNTAQYMYANFAETFPEGLILGAGDKTIVFTSPVAITQGLPSFGTPRKITESMIDPSARELANSFASKVAALTMVISFDRNDNNFATSRHTIGTCAFRDGIMAGMTVDRLLKKCNGALAGQSVGYPIKVLDKMVAYLLASYQPGSICNPILVPKSSATSMLSR